MLTTLDSISAIRSYLARDVTSLINTINRNILRKTISSSDTSFTLSNILLSNERYSQIDAEFTPRGYVLTPTVNDSQETTQIVFDWSTPGTETTASTGDGRILLASEARSRYHIVLEACSQIDTEISSAVKKGLTQADITIPTDTAAHLTAIDAQLGGIPLAYTRVSNLGRTTYTVNF